MISPSQIEAEIQQAFTSADDLGAWKAAWAGAHKHRCELLNRVAELEALIPALIKGARDGYGHRKTEAGECDGCDAVLAAESVMRGAR